MKTIAVLTDFSKRADNAAMYALYLAQHLHANLVLYNSFLVPSSQPLAAKIAWPMENFDDLKRDSEKGLEQLATKLQKELSILPFTGYQVSISCRSQEGNLAVHLSELTTDKEVILLVMANHRKGFASLFLSNNMHGIIENSSVPVLIIPEGREYTKLTKIAFATDLSDSDMEIINSLVGLFGSYNAEIMLTHVDADPSTTEAKIEKERFLIEVTNRIDYPKIYYRSITNGHIKAGLEWLTNYIACDMLVMIHRDKSFFTKLFNTSHTKKIAAETILPLLVYSHKSQD